MARKVEVHLIDDLDGGKAEESIRFGLDGISYETLCNPGQSPILYVSSCLNRLRAMYRLRDRRPVQEERHQTAHRLGAVPEGGPEAWSDTSRSRRHPWPRCRSCPR